MQTFALIHNKMYVLKLSKEKITILYTNKLIVLHLYIQMYIIASCRNLLPVSQYDAFTRDIIFFFSDHSVLIVVDYHKTPTPGRIELI